MPDTAAPSLHAAHAILPPGSPAAAGATAPAIARISAPRAQLDWLVRRGCFSGLPELAAVLSVEPADDPSDGLSGDTAWHGALRLACCHAADDSAIEIAGGARLLQGLTGIDFSAAAGGVASQPWLAAALAGRLAHTPFAGMDIAAPAAPALPPGAEELCCLRLTLRSRRHQLTSLARAPVATWLAFLSRTSWSHQRSPAALWLAARCETTVTLARHALPAAVLRTLAPGDVIVPASPRFSTAGKGWIQLGNRTIHVRYAAPNSLEILDVERNVMNDDMEYGPADDGLHTMDGDAGDGQGGTGDAAALFSELDAALPHDAPPAGGEEVPAGLDAVPVTLGFELGKLALPLGDIRTLGAGTVLLLDGGSPASVAITSAGQALGRGEIVDVAGQLGIRITHWGSPC